MDDESNIAEFLLELSKHQGGISCATVSDGHILVMSKAAVERLLDAASGSEREHVVVFIKRNDMKGS